MSGWSDDWNRQPQAGRGQAGRGQAGGHVDAYDDLDREEQRLPPGVSVRPSRPLRRKRHWGRIIGIVLLVLLVLLVGFGLLLDSRLNRVDALPDYSGRPAATPGTDWLVVGSDSRAGLTPEQRKQLATGNAEGQRTDTMMLLHIPRGGGSPTLVSLPRDSFVPIPGHGANKLNAAYAFGGPTLLVRTVEQVTGIRIDHYMEIGFASFASAVDAVGGVRICVDHAMVDPKAGLNIKGGCQVLNSREALGYVRTRASARGDLDRVQRQRQFLGALTDKAASPAVLLNPFKSIPLALRGTDSLTVARGDHAWHLLRFLLAMRSVSTGDGVATTVPIAGTGFEPGAGSVVRWDRTKALALFDALKEDRPVSGGA
jgi:LCP family protein required for cell wall assembly